MWPELINVFDLWYPIGVELPNEIKGIIYDYVFDPLNDPW